jgi:hypothetical protein
MEGILSPMENEMVTREDVESFLLRTQLDFEEVEAGMWLVQGQSNGYRLVVNHVPPLLVLRAKVLDVPSDQTRCAELYRRLLELNAGDLVHGAYALEEGDIILTDALELENLDFNEFQASIDSIQMALASHMESLAPFRNC